MEGLKIELGSDIQLCIRFPISEKPYHYNVMLGSFNIKKITEGVLELEAKMPIYKHSNFYDAAEQQEANESNNEFLNQVGCIYENE